MPDARLFQNRNLTTAARYPPGPPAPARDLVPGITSRGRNATKLTTDGESRQWSA